MATLHLPRVDLDEKALLLTGVDATRPWVPNVTTGDTVVDEHGNPVLVVVPYAEVGDLTALRRALLDYPRSTVVRAGGQRNDSNTFGYTPRRVLFQRNACRCAAGMIDAPRLHRVIADAGASLSEALRTIYPARAEHDSREAEAIRPEWRLDGSWFTSGVVNWNSALAYHYDRNNMDCWSAMVVVRRGVRGGHLHVPALGAVVDCRDGDAVLFHGRSLLHGVTPMRRLRADSYRVSAVWYVVDGLRHCLEPSAEARRAVNERTAREDTLLERQRAEGWLP